MDEASAKNERKIIRPGVLFNNLTCKSLDELTGVKILKEITADISVNDVRHQGLPMRVLTDCDREGSRLYNTQHRSQPANRGSAI